MWRGVASRGGNCSGFDNSSSLTPTIEQLFECEKGTNDRLCERKWPCCEFDPSLPLHSPLTPPLQARAVSEFQ